MKALVVDAEWAPRENYPLSANEKKQKKALVGSQIWRNPSFNIKEVPTPDIRDDEVLIRIKSCGICGSDTHLYETDEDGYIIFSGLTKLPCILGHEFTGIIEKTGDMVTNFNVGDRVAVESIMWCGMCQSCRSGAPNQCEHVDLMGLSFDGALAEYVAVNARCCWKIDVLSETYPEEDVFDIGALIEPIGCAYNGIFINGGGFRPGASVAVYGSGPIGLGAAALARTAGASLVIAFDVNDERVKIAGDMGADYAFNVNNMDGCTPGEKVLELTRGLGADVQVEAAGAASQTIPEMEKSLAMQGKIIYLGRTATTAPMFLDILVSRGSKIIGARGHSGYGIYPNIIRLLASHRLGVNKMITARYNFIEIIEAIDASTKRTDGKIMVNIS